MVKIIILLAFLLNIIFAMNQKELGVAIDHSVRQSVRTQKMVKEALLIYMGIEPKKNAKRMKFTVDMLNRDLDIFLGKKVQKNNKNGLKLPVIQDKKIKALMLDFEKYWRPIEKRAKEIIALKVNKDNVKFLVEHNLEFLKKSKAVVMALTKLSKNQNSKLKLANDIKVAGRQRMLTQIISKDILMFINNMQEEEALKDLSIQIPQINRAFKALFYGDKELKCIGVKLPNIVKQLKVAQEQWNEAKTKIVKVLRKKDKTQIKDLIAKLDSVRVNMRKAVVLYTLSINRQKEYLALSKIINNFEHREQKTKNLINLAGKQRMLSQRIAKLAIECSQNLRKDSCDALEKDLKLYGNILHLFKVGSQKLTFEPRFFKNAKGQIAKLQKIWQPFKKSAFALIKDKNNTKALNYILSHNEEILKESDNLVKLLLKYNMDSEDELKQEMLRVVNIAGKERMLSQKMTKELLEYRILNQKDKKEEMKKSIETFDLILRVLFNGNSTLQIPKVTNLEIKKQLQKVELIWSRLKPNYLKDNISYKRLHLILIANPIVQKEMDKTVSMIEKVTEF